MDSKFKVEKANMLGFKLLKGQVDSSEGFVVENIEGYESTTSLSIGTNLTEKTIKADIEIKIISRSSKQYGEEATGNFHLVYFFQIENLEELAQMRDTNLVQLEGVLANSLAAICYSTSRGILITRLQGTDLQGFMLPIINTNTLLKK